jgi:hypothetical protein
MILAIENSKKKPVKQFMTSLNFTYNLNSNIISWLFMQQFRQLLYRIHTF